jgi:hypothetical protein
VKFVLHHIPKTGGHSIVQSFRAVFGPDAVDVDNGDSPLVTTHGPSWVPFEDYPDRVHITILRDPEERIKSYIRYMRSVVSDTNGEDIAKLARDLHATKFLRLDHQAIRHMTHDRQVRQLGGFDFNEPPETMPQVLDRAMKALSLMAWIGHTETLTEDLDSLFELVGQPNPKLTPQNTSPRVPLDDTEGLETLTFFDKRLIFAWERFR